MTDATYPMERLIVQKTWYFTWTEGTSSKALMKSSSSTAPAPASLPLKEINMLTFNTITTWRLAELRLCSPVLFAVVAELGLLTELTTVFLPLGGALDEEEEEDRPPSTESLSSKVLSATEAEQRRIHQEISG